MALSGKVKWFDPRKGYGFIELEGGAGDVFLHYSEIAGEGHRVLKAGDHVTFELADSPKGKKAVRVTKT
ncbi:MAG: cold shock domain-containing protein [candidate division WOR-3 bacterium]